MYIYSPHANRHTRVCTCTHNVTHMQTHAYTDTPPFTHSSVRSRAEQALGHSSENKVGETRGNPVSELGAESGSGRGVGGISPRKRQLVLNPQALTLRSGPGGPRSIVGAGSLYTHPRSRRGWRVEERPPKTLRERAELQGVVSEQTERAWALGGPVVARLPHHGAGGGVLCRV